MSNVVRKWKWDLVVIEGNEYTFTYPKKVSDTEAKELLDAEFPAPQFKIVDWVEDDRTFTIRKMY